MTCLQTLIVYYIAKLMATLNEQAELGMVLTYPQFFHIFKIAFDKLSASVYL